MQVFAVFFYLAPQQVAQLAGAGQRGRVLHFHPEAQRVLVAFLAYHHLEVKAQVRHFTQRVLDVVDE